MSREQSGGLSVTTLLIASGSADGGRRDRPAVLGTGQPRSRRHHTSHRGPHLRGASKSPSRSSRRRRGLAQDARWHRGPPARRPRLRGPTTPRSSASRSTRRRRTIRSACASPSAAASSRGRRSKLALVTGALAFAIAAVVVTASELAIFGDSVGGSHRTTFFGGKSQGRRRRRPPDPDGHAGGQGATRRRRRPRPRRRRRRREGDRDADPDPERGAERRHTRARVTPAPTP